MRRKFLFSSVALALVAFAPTFAPVAHAGDWNHFMRCIGFGHSEGYHATGKWCCGPQCRIGNCGHGIPIDSCCGPQVPYASSTIIGTGPVRGVEQPLYAIMRSPTVTVQSRSALAPAPKTHSVKTRVPMAVPTVTHETDEPTIEMPTIAPPKSETPTN